MKVQIMSRTFRAHHPYHPYDPYIREQVTQIPRCLHIAHCNKSSNHYSIAVAINEIIIYYLYRPHVKEYFGRSSVQY